MLVGGIDKLSDDELIKLASKLLDTVRDMGIHASAAENSAAMEELAAQQGPQPAVQFVADNVEKPRTGLQASLRTAPATGPSGWPPSAA